MELKNLEPLETFELDGVEYEVIEVYPGGRIAACYELKDGNYIETGKPEEPYKIRLVSDVRYNRRYGS